MLAATRAPDRLVTCRSCEADAPTSGRFSSTSLDRGSSSRLAMVAWLLPRGRERVCDVHCICAYMHMHIHAHVHVHVHVRVHAHVHVLPRLLPPLNEYSLVCYRPLQDISSATAT